MGNNNVEIWKDVVGYEKYFQVSNNGKIWSKRTNKILKLAVNSGGYSYFGTIIGGKNGINKTFIIHTLVAKHFITHVKGKSHVNHKDGNKINNHVDNLEWCTPKENMQHASLNGFLNNSKGEYASWSKFTESQVLEIRKIHKSGCRINGARALARKYNVTKGSIDQIIKRKTWKHI